MERRSLRPARSRRPKPCGRVSAEPAA